jgi:hypothetical protein
MRSRRRALKPLVSPEQSLNGPAFLDFRTAPRMNDLLRRVFVTDCGMLALWQPEQFRNVVDYVTWEPELLEDADIFRHIQQGALVPINVESDGAFECTVRAGSDGMSATLSDRENRYRLASSEPYLFRSLGVLSISGIEHIDRSPREASSSVPLAAGDWVVTVHFLDWTQEPGAQTADGKPAPGTLPDFVVLLDPATPGMRFRTKITTFERLGGA